MSLRSMSRWCMAFLVLLTAAACGDQNPNAPFDPDTGKHPANWLPAGHTTVATNDLTTCADCHGQDFQGGIANIACNDCHLGGPLDVHPASWLSDACFSHGIYVANNGTAACANMYCHGTGLAGVAGSGPSCTTCHDPIPGTNSCGTCHGIPPSGSSFPNIAGSHGVHTSAPLNYIVCGSCHASSCETHNNGTVNVAISTIFYAKSAGTVTFNGSTCSEISCHGGQTTPNWVGGSINVDTQCTSCHAYNVNEYNTFKSGRHNLHVNGEGIACTSCHDTTLLAVNHFTTLNTSAMEGPAWKTIKASIGYNGSTCANPCHDPERW